MHPDPAPRRHRAARPGSAVPGRSLRRCRPPRRAVQRDRNRPCGSPPVSLAVVTGGTRGIGRAVSLRLADDGHDVVALATAMPPEPLPGVAARICDISDEDQVVSVFCDIGDVDILVNNAGVASSNPLARTTLAEWERCLAVNATGSFLCARAVIGAMLRRDSGRIVTVASSAAVEGGPYIAAYAASKHAVLGLMRVVAAEVAGTGVTANTVCPTYVRTDMTVATIANISARTGVSLSDAEAKLAETTPHNRIIEVAEVAETVLGVIATDHNGREILLDGRPS
ncbi:MAG: SDR family oxidoreductase [Acidimicrobiaceae bacterium]|nr:SDR family oxidoreductase [Acidimicrobiaceae bacterium]MYE75079.1 SDR family oxidoreductase [Acidimicrobiaceae bacterium]MYH43494.1 SDR family oxidoreductase [Acidimicrobiaceae bacterium]MYJ43399.1 SDR family oxidoreductase [Acidimicrobiaceae bacterium]MYK75029.1 SDR family oxidoreductase [Acidimicrobiaceae bacterium]